MHNRGRCSLFTASNGEETPRCGDTGGRSSYRRDNLNPGQAKEAIQIARTIKPDSKTSAPRILTDFFKFRLIEKTAFTLSRDNLLKLTLSSPLRISRDSGSKMEVVTVLYL